MLPRRPLLLGAGGWLAACGAPPRAPVSTLSSVDDLAAELDALVARQGAAAWSRAVGRSHELHDEAALADLLRRQQATVSALVRACRAEADRLDPREVELWIRAERGLRLLADPASVALCARLDRTLREHPFEADGARVSRQKLDELAQSGYLDERRAAYRAWAALHREMAPVIRELFLRRRALAAEAGLPVGFYEALLELRGLSFERLRGLLGRLEERTRGPFIDLMVDLRNLFEKDLTLRDLDWLQRSIRGSFDDDFPPDRALPLAREIWASLGLDLDASGIHFDRSEQPFGAQTFMVRPPEEIRVVLGSCKDQRLHPSLLRALGHGLFALKNQEKRAAFRLSPSILGLGEMALLDGVAETFARLLDEPELLALFLPGMNTSRRASFLRGRRWSELLGLRRSLLLIAFERAALADPSQDLDALWFQLHRDLLGIERAGKEEPTWAISPFLGASPVLAPSPLLAAMVSCQVRSELRARFGGAWASPRAGAVLVAELVADGGRRRLEEKLRKLTGKALDAEAYGAWLTES
ncbi:MAG: hypothetical protein MUF64_19615 [Polyangiaceae bacterium]|nr:hypothetical protein [Polyangiaceae bacterium]